LFSIFVTLFLKSLRIASATRTENFRTPENQHHGGAADRQAVWFPDPASALKYCVLDIDRADLSQAISLPFSLVLLRHYCKSFQCALLKDRFRFSTGKALQS